MVNRVCIGNRQSAIKEDVFVVLRHLLEVGPTTAAWITIAAVFRLRATRPNAERPYRVPGYPLIPALYILGAAVVLVILFAYRPATTWPGLIIVLVGGVIYGIVGRYVGARPI